MAILMPSLKAAREQARSIHCRSNIKNLTLAWLMYKDANDDKLVGGHPPAVNQGPWVLDPANGANASVEEKKEYIMKGLLWPYVKKIDVYHCASDRRQNSVWHKNAYRTYSIAGGMNGVSPTGGWEILPCIKYSDIRNPAAKYVFLAECDPRGYNMGSWVMYPKSRQWVDPFAIWHSKNKSTLGWADGHVGMHRWFGRGLIEWNLRALYEPQSFQFYRTPDSDDEFDDFEFALKGYAYKAFQQ